MKNFTAYHLLKSFNKATNNPNNIVLNNVENSPGGFINSFNVYPNPSAGSFNIDVEHMNSSQIVNKVYNSLGQQIETMVQVVNEKTVSVDINKQASGLYTIELILNQKIIGRTKLSITE